MKLLFSFAFSYPILALADAGRNCLEKYAFFSDEFSDLRDRGKIVNGNLGSNTSVEVGVDAIIKGNLVSGGTGIIRDRGKIDGNASTKGLLTRYNQTFISGVILRDSTYVNCYPHQNNNISIGSTNLSVGPEQIQSIDPGNYGDVIIYSRSEVKLQKGTYSFRTLVLEPDVKIKFTEKFGTSISVRDELRFSDRNYFEFVGANNPLAINIYTNQQNPLRIGTDSRIMGVIQAPNAQIGIASRTKIIGQITAKRIIIEPDVFSCVPPKLIDLAHSQITYGPFFQPSHLNYKSTLAPSITQLSFSPTQENPADLITINGSTNKTISIPDTTFSIDIKVSRTQLEGIPTECFETHYTLETTKSANYSVKVNSSSACPPGRCDGSTWENALVDLQAGLDIAEEQGKEVWVAEGTYTPSKRTNSSDPKSATFRFGPGSKLIGSFIGSEAANIPNGSPRNTVLTGDLEKNDHEIVNWPPVTTGDKLLMNDNAYHVIIFDGDYKSKGSYFEGFSINNGAGLGFQSEDQKGGGILILGASPQILNCVLSRNASKAGGGAIYNESSPELFSNVQLLDNYVQNGHGGGVYSQSKNIFNMNRVVFKGNQTQNGNGGALYNTNSTLNIYNSIFVNNTSIGKGGAIANNYGVVLSQNSTITQNISNNSGCIHNNASTSTLVNSICWQNSGGELGGPNIFASHSVITGGFVGTGNISLDPKFADAARPAGIDGGFFSVDDGLQLTASSPAIDAGTEVANMYISSDFLDVERPINGDNRNSSESDIGAYEYLNINEIDANLVGNYHEVTGTFKSVNPLTIIDNIENLSEIDWLSKSSAAYTIQTTMKKNKHIKDSFYGRLFAVSGNTQVSQGFQVWFYKIREIGNDVTYSTQRLNSNGSMDGRPLILVTDPHFENGANPKAYILQSIQGSILRFVVPHSQFK